MIALRAGSPGSLGSDLLVMAWPSPRSRVEEHALPLEDIRARAAYGVPSAVNRLLILNADPRPGRATVLLLREVIGY
jgi:hypothetical protein